jgi:hypothetical protein
MFVAPATLEPFLLATHFVSNEKAAERSLTLTDEEPLLKFPPDSLPVFKKIAFPR